MAQAAIDLTRDDTKPDTALTIPASIQSLALPPAWITSLLRYEQLPHVSSAHLDSSVEVEEWFSHLPPNADIGLATLASVPLPSLEVITKLVKAIEESKLTSLQSIIPHHLTPLHQTIPGRFPLWIVTFWQRAFKAREHRRDWAAAAQWVEKHACGTSEGRGLQKRVLSMFAELRWEDSVSGATSGRFVRDLSRFLGSRPLPGEQIHQLLELLRMKRSLSGTISSEAILDVEFVEALDAARNADPKTIDSDKHFKTLRRIEADIIAGYKTVVSGIIFVNENHWTFFVLDLKSRTLGYGDSFGGKMPAHIRAAFTWWLDRLAGLGAVPKEDGGGEWPIQTLPVTQQKPGDVWSCGILAVNGLEQALLRHPLVQPDQESIAHLRMRYFLEICQIHLDNRVESLQSAFRSASFADKAVGAKFTFVSPVKHSSYALASSSSRRTPDIHIPAVSDASIKHTSPSTTKGKRVRMADSDDEAIALAAESDTDNALPTFKRARSGTNNSDTFSSSSRAGSDSNEDAFSDDSETYAHRNKSSAQVEDLSTRKKTAGPITDFFPRLSKEEREVQEAREWAAMAERRERRLEAEELDRQRMADKKREKNRNRQQKHRAAKRKERESEDIPVKGRPVKTRKLKAFDDAGTSQNEAVSTVADDSRPYRQLKNSLLKTQNGKRGRPKSEKTLTKNNTASRVNWQQPALWKQILDACDYVGRPWEPTKIRDRLRAVNPRSFAQFQAQRISDWRDKNFPDKLVWTESVQRRVADGNLARGNVTRQGILAAHPQVATAIKDLLKSLRSASVKLDLVTVRGLMIGIITHHAPELFETPVHGNQRFVCSEAFVRRFLKRNLGWSLRRATRAGQKVPSDADELIRRLSLRMAAAIRDEDITAPFIVNTDQTQVVYSTDGKFTYDIAGAKQVQVEGKEEKRAFTLVVGVSMSGEALPFQAVYHGVAKRSLPSSNANMTDRATELGFKFELSHSKTYWSTQQTMRSYVTDILAPYFAKQKDLFERPDQKCLWLIDIWSVHRSREFREWMQKTHPWILINYVPGGCTGLAQPCDVGIQRPLKHAIKRSAHKHVVDETMEKLREGVPAPDIKLDKSIGVLRDRSVEWMVRGYEAINDKDFIMKVWEKCTAGTFNLSYKSLSSPAMRQELNKIAQTAFYMEITAGRSQDAPTPVDEPVEDQVPCEDDETRDDVSIPIQKVKKRAVKVSRRKRKPAVPVLSDSDNDSGVEGYEGIALVNGEVKSVAPTREATVDQWLVGGISLGGHATWWALRHEPRLSVGIPIIGCPNYTHLISQRAAASGVTFAPPIVPNTFLSYLNATDAARVPYTSSNPSENPFIGKKILVLSGADDKVVPWVSSEEVVRDLNVGVGVKKVIVYPGVGHEVPDEMVKETGDFIWEHSLSA